MQNSKAFRRRIRFQLLALRQGNAHMDLPAVCRFNLVKVLITEDDIQADRIGHDGIRFLVRHRGPLRNEFRFLRKSHFRSILFHNLIKQLCVVIQRLLRKRILPCQRSFVLINFRCRIRFAFLDSDTGNVQCVLLRYLDHLHGHILRKNAFLDLCTDHDAIFILRAEFLGGHIVFFRDFRERLLVRDALKILERRLLHFLFPALICQKYAIHQIRFFIQSSPFIRGFSVRFLISKAPGFGRSIALLLRVTALTALRIFIGILSPVFLTGSGIFISTVLAVPGVVIRLFIGIFRGLIGIILTVIAAKPVVITGIEEIIASVPLSLVKHLT